MNEAPQWLKSLIKAEALPPEFEPLAVDFYLPLAESIVSWAQNNPHRPLVVGVNGAQGTGKSTLSKVLALALEKEHQLNCAIISIDDIYLTQKERVKLSEDIHPLLQTRGAPGTHDISLGIELIQQLKSSKPTKVPVFDKAIDDRAPEEKWISCDTPVDIILFEGWCVGAIPQETQALSTPCNHLEKSEDNDAAWRTYANQQLEGPYTDLFDLMDKLVMLKAPDFECVYQWRKTQEEKLRQRTTESGMQNHSVMNDEQIKRFIMHYERLTRWMFEEMPKRADYVIELNQAHNVVRAGSSQS